MAEEKNTEQTVNDILNTDDTEMLRAVLHSAGARGITPVSVYRQADYDDTAAE